jgi:hypothetical protein
MLVSNNVFAFFKAQPSQGQPPKTPAVSLLAQPAPVDAVCFGAKKVLEYVFNYNDKDTLKAIKKELNGLGYNDVARAVTDMKKNFKNSTVFLYVKDNGNFSIGIAEGRKQ